MGFRHPAGPVLVEPRPPAGVLPSYRHDIDGLRAVAVLLVLADHFRTHFSGGYVGVDVFFVISGYLISAAILKEMGDGTFSILRFYERRIRRIFPALIVMLLGTSALAYRYLFPSELADYARSLLAAVTSVSNFWFYHQQGYFDAPSAFKPLLHTWSLAVEEQFYLVFPLFLVVIRWIAPKQLKSAVFALAAIAFALSVYVVRRDASAAFFFSPLRAWELLIGTIVSQRYLPRIRSNVGRNVATLSGFLLILVPAVAYVASTPFPGLAALPPCVGAALIIAGGETGTSLVGRVLSLRPITFVGLISYSLYLWHWPVLVFQNIGLMVARLPGNDRRLKLMMFAVSLVLACVSWRFVETPIRKGALRPGARSLFLMSGVGVAAVMGLAVLILASGGATWRFPADALQAAGYLTYSAREPFRQGTCFLGGNDTFAAFTAASCLHEVTGKPSVLLLGDSQAAQLWPGMQQVYPEIQTLQATAAFCFVAPTMRPDERPACSQLAHMAFEDILSHHHVDAVLYGGRWLDSNIPAIEESIGWMQRRGIQVYLLGPMIEYDEMFPRVLATALRDHAAATIAQHLEPGPRAMDERLAVLARDRWHVPYLSYYQNLCTPDCPNYGAPGVPLLFDEHHLTAAGSVLFVQTMRNRQQLRVGNAVEAGK